MEQDGDRAVAMGLPLHQGVAAVEEGLHQQGAAGLVKADCHVGA